VLFDTLIQQLAELELRPAGDEIGHSRGSISQNPASIGCGSLAFWLICCSLRGWFIEALV